jgi:hypothetical protein
MTWIAIADDLDRDPGLEAAEKALKSRRECRRRGGPREGGDI